jgi:hypothetical protein
MAVEEEQTMKTALAGVVAGCVLLATGAQPALAQQQQKQKQQENAGFVMLGKPVAAAALDRERGGKNLVINKMQVDGTVHDNNAVNTVSGANFISDSAFSHASGLPVAIQNSGNNVSIQNAYIVNIHTDMQ